MDLFLFWIDAISTASWQNQWNLKDLHIHKAGKFEIYAETILNIVRNKPTENDQIQTHYDDVQHIFLTTIQ